MILIAHHLTKVDILGLRVEKWGPIKVEFIRFFDGPSAGVNSPSFGLDLKPTIKYVTIVSDVGRARLLKYSYVVYIRSWSAKILLRDLD